jgi:hypothetical protein
MSVVPTNKSKHTNKTTLLQTKYDYTWIIYITNLKYIL